MSVLSEVEHYYSGKLRQHGATPNGVDWNGSDGQIVRFQQLLQVTRGKPAYSLNDLGCGYGALLDHIDGREDAVDYCGYDIAPDMVTAAKERFQLRANTRFAVAAAPDRVADVTVASGIFNVRLQHETARWEEYFHDTLEKMNASSRLGFAFNCLTSYSDEDRKRPDLYYCNPCDAFDWCRSRYSRNVALLHDYNLYEFTIVVRKLEGEAS